LADGKLIDTTTTAIDLNGRPRILCEPGYVAAIKPRFALNLKGRCQRHGSAGAN
jgi:hypothetical protein